MTRRHLFTAERHSPLVAASTLEESTVMMRFSNILTQAIPSVACMNGSWSSIQDRSECLRRSEVAAYWLDVRFARNYASGIR